MPKIPIEFETGTTQRRYVEFKEFLDDKKHDPAMLEIASSICYLADIGMEKSEILRLVENKRPSFSAEQCGQAWDDLARYGVVGGRHG